MASFCPGPKNPREAELRVDGLICRETLGWENMQPSVENTTVVVKGVRAWLKRNHTGTAGEWRVRPHLSEALLCEDLN